MAEATAVIDEELGLVAEMKSGNVWILHRNTDADDLIVGVVVPAEGNYAYKPRGEAMSRLGPFETPQAAARALVSIPTGS